MSQSPAGGSPAPSPAKPTGSTGSALKSRIAAFESGAAANASKRDQSKDIPHADLSNLRSRFVKEGEKPLEVKGSFGLGATPLTSGRGGPGSAGGGKDGQRAVSLGIGRAVSPMQAPTVIPPSLSGTGRSASSTTVNTATSGNGSETRIPASTSRPLIPRSDSMGSNSTSATSTSISGATATSTASSLLPGPLAALRGASGSQAAHPNSPYGGVGDDSTSTGLRTPMSSVSLSSMRVEAGSVAGDVASSSGDTTANEDEPSVIIANDELVATKHKERSSPDLAQAGKTDAEADQSVEDSAATLEQKKEQERDEPTPLVHEESLDVQAPTQEAVERAAEELDKYAQEESSTTAVMSPPLPESALSPSASLSQLGVPGADADSSLLDRTPTPPASSSRKSPSRASSAVFSPQDRLKRSSTANSIASHPESDLADTNLETFDEQDDAGKAKMIADSMAPASPSGSRRGSKSIPVTPSRSKIDMEPKSPLDDLLAKEQDFAPADAVGDGDEDGAVDEDGMPLVKCSDCGARVSVVKLGEHVCAASVTSPSSASNVAFPASQSGDALSKSSLTSPRDRRETGPEDVPKGALSPETVDSPNMSHRSITSSRPDVPDDESASVASITAGMEETSVDDDQVARQDSFSAVQTDAEEGEEEYMTALTSRRDSTDTGSSQRPEFGREGGNGALGSGYYGNDEDDETEELALGMAEHPVDTPRIGSFGQKRQTLPDSPTPEHRRLPLQSTTGHSTPQAGLAENKLSTPSYDIASPAGVRRRSSARKNKALGDTDSEGEIEPGTVTIIR